MPKTPGNTGLQFITRSKVLVTRVLKGICQQGSGSKVSGTGWLIAPGLLITNHHVIEARDHRYEAPASESDFRGQAANALAWFDYNDDDAEHWEYASTELLHANETLDYALLCLTSSPTGGAVKPLSEWGFLRIIPTRLELSRGYRLNIIQHPLGGPKRLAIRSNFYVDRYSRPEEPERIRYLTDTQPGSSGSPVLNDDWQVIALHRASVAVPEEQYRGEVIKYNNEGVCIGGILEDLPSPIRQDISAAQA